MAAKHLPCKFILVIIMIIIIVMNYSCKSSETTFSIPTVVSFAGDIQPVFDEACVSCHNLTTFSGGLNLSPDVAYKSLVNAKSDQSTRVYVKPGSPDSSYLVNKLKGTQSNVGGLGSRMPLGASPLPDSEIDMIRQWISQGALNN